MVDVASNCVKRKQSESDIFEKLVLQGPLKGGAGGLETEFLIAKNN